MSALKKIWNGWKRFSTLLGNVQMVVLLTVIYWTMLAVVAIPFKLLSDPLAIKKSAKPKWIPRDPASDVLDQMPKQG